MGLRATQEENGMAAESLRTQARHTRAEGKTYKSPQRKLVPFFAQSRDQWKEKCRGAKARLKQLKKKVQRGEARHHRHQERLLALAGEVSRLQAENRRLAEALAAGEKKERGAE
jgi:predicted nuclease with TOPRIM domain